jgi:hypothetical protein
MKLRRGAQHDCDPDGAEGGEHSSNWQIAHLCRENLEQVGSGVINAKIETPQAELPTMER